MLDVRQSRELTAALISLKRANREIRLDINKEARKRLAPVWREALRGHVETRTEDRVILPGARVAVGVRQVSFKAATSSRALRGGLVPSVDWPSVELGARVRQATFVTTSRRGKKFTVTRTVNKQFRPRQKQGRVAFAAASIAGRRLVGMWVETIVDLYRDAFNGKTS